MSTEQLKTPEAGAESEQAHLQANRIDMDFSNLDVRALNAANEQTGIKDYVTDLQTKLGETQQTIEKLRSAITAGEHNTEDLTKKVAFQELLNAAEFKANHPFARPRDTKTVRSEQADLENAAGDFQKRYVQPAKRINATLRGEQDPHKRDPGDWRGGVADFAKEYKVDNVREKLPPDQLTRLQDKVASTLGRLRDLQPQIEEIAAQKALSPDEKDETLESYSRMHEEYEKVRGELAQVVKAVEKARK